MHPFAYTALVTLLALALYFSFSWGVGRARATCGVKAPATTGHPDFERAYRVQMNTLEWLPVFLVSLWLCAIYVDDRVAAALGIVWIVGRALYQHGYMQAANKRGTGFLVQALATVALWLTALGGVIATMVR
jgi:uncharacterized membrane protein YecN with MAPEG domain